MLGIMTGEAAHQESASACIAKLRAERREAAGDFLHVEVGGFCERGAGASTRNRARAGCARLPHRAAGQRRKPPSKYVAHRRHAGCGEEISGWAAAEAKGWLEGVCRIMVVVMKTRGPRKSAARQRLKIAGSAGDMSFW